LVVVRRLYAAIDSVADNPYNTYRHAGLPPGPIGSPGEHALEAALYPEDTRHFYFVARPDGTHVFTETLDEHNVAKARAGREWDTTRSSVGVRGPDMDSSSGIRAPVPE
jgi:cell division protein YceG involved in septum cleavage